jgi:wyosine [tRNA(Phe)-imidazoG37] synthetase (radical SAM superfamily)
MATFLFDSIIFGPVWSRRLGESLGINLLPVNRKVCNFNCIYCECGLTPALQQHSEFPSAEMVKDLLGARLILMRDRGEYLDSITFAGNGEPTLHPDFLRIIMDTVEIRDKVFPKAKITVLSNATLIGKNSVFDALQLVNLNILKLDSAIDETLRLINCPKGDYFLRELLQKMQSFNGRIIIQTLFFKGYYNDKYVDNTSTAEISAWLAALQQIRPESVMIYSIARDTAIEGLTGIPSAELEIIARRVEMAGICTQVTP